MKLYQIKEYDRYSDYNGDYRDHFSDEADGPAIFFSEDAARAYCEKKNLETAEADADKCYQAALGTHNSMVKAAREHNALVAAGLRKEKRTVEPSKKPKREDYPLIFNDRWPEFIYEEFKSMDEPTPLDEPVS
jgi:hypothetical protein